MKKVNNIDFPGINPLDLEKINSLIDQYNIFNEKYNNTSLSNKFNIRFQDYFDINNNSFSNIDFFKQYCPVANNDSIILYCKYMLDKTLEDLFCIIDEPELGVETLLEVINDNGIFDDALEIMCYVDELIYNKTDELDKLINYVILPEDSSYIEEILVSNNSGVSSESIERGKKAVHTMLNASYTDPGMSAKVHKLVDNNNDHNVRLTDNKIILERYSTSGRTKVCFIKLPIHEQNIDIIKNIFGNQNFENMYYVFGFGNFKLSGYSEVDFYREWLNAAYRLEVEMNEYVKLLANPLIYEINGEKIDHTNELKEIIIKNNEKLNNFGNGIQK